MLNFPPSELHNWTTPRGGSGSRSTGPGWGWTSQQRYAPGAKRLPPHSQTTTDLRHRDTTRKSPWTGPTAPRADTTSAPGSRPLQPHRADRPTRAAWPRRRPLRHRFGTAEAAPPLGCGSGLRRSRPPHQTAQPYPPHPHKTPGRGLLRRRGRDSHSLRPHRAAQPPRSRFEAAAGRPCPPGRGLRRRRSWGPAGAASRSRGAEPSVAVAAASLGGRGCLRRFCRRGRFAAA